MTEATMEQTFNHFIKMDVSDHVDEKMGLKYLSWTWAWMMIKKYDPNAEKRFTAFPEYDWRTGQLTGRDVDYCKTDTGTYVECTVTIKGHSETETLPVMDYKNKSVPAPDQMQINKSKQRCFVKSCALFGLGLNLYAGEDEPMDHSVTDKQKENLRLAFQKVGDLTNQDGKELQRETIASMKIKDIDDLNRDQAEQLLNKVDNRVHALAAQASDQQINTIKKVARKLSEQQTSDAQDIPKNASALCEKAMKEAQVRTGSNMNHSAANRVLEILTQWLKKTTNQTEGAK